MHSSTIFISITLLLWVYGSDAQATVWCSYADSITECNPLLYSTQAPRPCIRNATSFDVTPCSSRPCTGVEQTSVCGVYSHHCRADCSVESSQVVCSAVATTSTCAEAPSPARYCSYEEIQSIPTLAPLTPADAIDSCRVVCTDALLTTGCSLEYRVGGEWFPYIPGGTTRSCTDEEFGESCASERDGCIVACDQSGCTRYNRCPPSASFTTDTIVPMFHVLSDTESSTQCGMGWASDPDRSPCRARACERTNALGLGRCWCDLSTCGCPNRIPDDNVPCSDVTGVIVTPTSELGSGSRFDAQVYCGTYARRASISCVGETCTLVPGSCECKTNVYPIGGVPCGGVASVCTRAEYVSCGPSVTSCVFVHARGLYITPSRPAQGDEYVRCLCAVGSPAPIGPLFTPYQVDTPIPDVMSAVDADLAAQVSSAWWQPTSGLSYAIPSSPSCPRTSDMSVASTTECGGGTGLFTASGSLAGCICNPSTHFYAMGVLGFAECIPIPQNDTHLLVNQQIERAALTVRVPTDADTASLATELCSYLGGCVLNVSSAYAERVPVRVSCPLGVAYRMCGTWFDPATDSCNVTASVYPSYSTRHGEDPIYLNETATCGCVSDSEYVFKFDNKLRRPCYSASKARVACSKALTESLCGFSIDDTHPSESIIELGDGNTTLMFDTNAAGYSIDRCEAYPFRMGSNRLVEGSCPGVSTVRECTQDERDTFCGGDACMATCTNSTCRLWGVCPSDVDCVDGSMATHCNNRNIDETGCSAQLIQTRFGVRVETSRVGVCRCMSGFSGDSCEFVSSSTCDLSRCGPTGSVASCTETRDDPHCVCNVGFGHVAPLSRPGTYYDQNTKQPLSRADAVSTHAKCEGILTSCGADLAGEHASSCQAYCPDGNSTSLYCRLASWHCTSSTGMVQSSDQFRFEFALMSRDPTFRTTLKPCDQLIEPGTETFSIEDSGMQLFDTFDYRTSTATVLAAMIGQYGPGVSTAQYTTTNGVIKGTSYTCRSVYIAGYLEGYGRRPCAIQSYSDPSLCTTADKAEVGTPCNLCNGQATGTVVGGITCGTSHEIVRIESHPNAATVLPIVDRFGIRSMFNLYMRKSHPTAIFFLDPEEVDPLITVNHKVSSEIAKFVCGDYVKPGITLRCKLSLTITDLFPTLNDPQRNYLYPQGIEPTCSNSMCVCDTGGTQGQDGRTCSRNYRVEACTGTEAISMCKSVSASGCTKRVYADGSTAVHACVCQLNGGKQLDAPVYSRTISGTKYTWFGPHYTTSDVSSGYASTCQCTPGDATCLLPITSCKAREVCGAYAVSALATCVGRKCTPTKCVCSLAGVTPPGVGDLALQCSAFRSSCSTDDVTRYCPPVRDAAGFITATYLTCETFTSTNGTSGLIPGTCAGLRSTVRSCATDREKLLSCGPGAESCMWDSLRGVPLPNVVSRACVCKPGYHWDTEKKRCSSVVIGVYACALPERCGGPTKEYCRKRVFRMDKDVDPWAISTLRVVRNFMRGTGDYTLLSTARSSTSTTVTYKDITYIDCRCTGPFGVTTSYSSAVAYSSLGDFWQSEYDQLVLAYDAGNNASVVVNPHTLKMTCPTLTKTQLFNYEILYGTCPGMQTTTPICNNRGACQVVTARDIEQGVTNSSWPLRVGLNAISNGFAPPVSVPMTNLLTWLRGTATELGASFSRVYFLNADFRNLAAQYPLAFTHPRAGELFEGQDVMSTFDFVYTTPTEFRTVGYRVACDLMASASTATDIQAAWLNPHASRDDSWTPYTSEDLLTTLGRTEGASTWLLKTPTTNDFAIRLGHVTGSNAVGLPSQRFRSWNQRQPTVDTCSGGTEFHALRKVRGDYQDMNFYALYHNKRSSATGPATQADISTKEINYVGCDDKSQNKPGPEGRQGTAKVLEERARFLDLMLNYRGPVYTAVDSVAPSVAVNTGRMRTTNVRYGEFDQVNSPCDYTIAQPLERTGGYMHTYKMTAQEALRSTQTTADFVWEDHVDYLVPPAGHTFFSAARTDAEIDASGRRKPRAFFDYRWALNPNRDQRFRTQCEHVHSNECQTMSCEYSLDRKRRYLFKGTGKVDKAGLYQRIGPALPDRFSNGTLRLDTSNGDMPFVCRLRLNSNDKGPFVLPRTIFHYALPHRSDHAFDRNGIPCRTVYKSESEYIASGTRQWCSCSLALSHLDATIPTDGDKDPLAGVIENVPDDYSLTWDRQYGNYVRTIYNQCFDGRGARYLPFQFEFPTYYASNVYTIRSYSPVHLQYSSEYNYHRWCRGTGTDNFQGMRIVGWRDSEIDGTDHMNAGYRAFSRWRGHGSAIPYEELPGMFRARYSQDCNGVEEYLEIATRNHRVSTADTTYLSRLLFSIPDLYPYVHEVRMNGFEPNTDACQKDDWVETNLNWFVHAQLHYMHQTTRQMQEFMLRSFDNNVWSTRTPMDYTGKNWYNYPVSTNYSITFTETPVRGKSWFRISMCDLTMHRGAMFMPRTPTAKVNDFDIKPFMDTLNKHVCTDQEQVATFTGTGSNRCPPLYPDKVGIASSHPQTPRTDVLAQVLGNPAARVVDFQMFTPAICMSAYNSDCSLTAYTYQRDPRSVRMTAMENRASLKPCGTDKYVSYDGFHPEHVAARGYARAYSMFTPGDTASVPRLLPTLISYYNGSIFTKPNEAPVNVMRSSPLYLHFYGVEMHPQSIRRSATESSFRGTSAFGFSHAMMYDWAEGYTARDRYDETMFPRPYAYTSSNVTTPQRCYALADVGPGSKTTRDQQQCTCLPNFDQATTTTNSKLDGECDHAVYNGASFKPYYMFPPNYGDGRVDYGYCLYTVQDRCVYNPNWDPRKWCVNGRFDPVAGGCICDPGYKTQSGTILSPCTETVDPCPGLSCPSDEASIDTTSCTCACGPMDAFPSTYGAKCDNLVSSPLPGNSESGYPLRSPCSFQGATSVSGSTVSCNCFGGNDGGGWSGADCSTAKHSPAVEALCTQNGGTMVISTKCRGFIGETSTVNTNITTDCATVPFSTCVCNDPLKFGQACEYTKCPIGPNGKVCSGVGTCSLDSKGNGVCSCNLPCDKTANAGTPECAAAYSKLIAGDVSALPWWGGCACEFNLRRECTKPGTSSLCGGYNSLAVDTISRELSKCVLDSGFSQVTDAFSYHCDCSKAGETNRRGTYCDESICPADSNGNACSGRTCKSDGTCDCNTDRAALGSFEVRMGARCEILAPSCEGASIAGIPTICNNHGSCVCNGSNCGCVCNALYDGAQCQYTQCAVPCGVGSCVLPSGSSVRECRCTNPAVIGLGSTGSCDRNACLYGALPSTDNSTCVCTNPRALYSLGCNEPPCPVDSGSGYYCGKLHPIDQPTANGYPLKSELKFCDTSLEAGAACRCGIGYVKNTTTGSCDFYCNEANTALMKFENAVFSCVCKLGFEGDTCAVRSCPDGAEVNTTSTSLATKCICPTGSIYYSATTSCVKHNCTINGTPVVPGTTVVDCASGTCRSIRTTGFCSCARGWTGVDCATPVCKNGGFWDTSTSTCTCAAGWSGVTCAISLCTAPYVFNTTSGTCGCAAGYTGIGCGTIICGQYGTRDPLVPSRCICSSVASNTFCDALDCVGGEVTTLNGVRSCSCPLDFSVVKASDGTLSCVHQSCGSAGVPYPVSANVTCKCDDTYMFVRWANTSYRCVPDCNGHGVPDTAVLDLCTCFDGYSGRRCATANNSTGTPPDPGSTGSNGTKPDTPVVGCGTNTTCICIRDTGSECVSSVSKGASTPIGAIVGGSVGGAVVVAVGFMLWFHYH